jgi:hypothetical protein
VGTAAVGVDFFDVLGTPILAGRAFHAGDVASEARVVIVNLPFVQRVLGGRAPLGRRLRHVIRTGPDGQVETGPWHEVVGVVGDLAMVAGDVAARDAGFYHPAAPGAAAPHHLIVRARGDPMSLAPRLRELAAAVDPSLRLYDVLPLDQVGFNLWMEFAFLFRLLVVLSAIALLLSLAGIYAVLAFTVARRTREIGIRIALGAVPRQLILSIFRRPLIQVGVGVVAGGVLVGALSFGALPELSAGALALIACYAALMMAVCMLACIVPTRQALGIAPTEALKAE